MSRVAEAAATLAPLMHKYDGFVDLHIGGDDFAAYATAGADSVTFDATATIGSASYVLYTQNDGAWVKNAAEEAHMVEAMRKGADVVVKSESARGTKTTDTYSLKGIGDALEKVATECK